MGVLKDGWMVAELIAFAADLQAVQLERRYSSGVHWQAVSAHALEFERYEGNAEGLLLLAAGCMYKRTNCGAGNYALGL